MTASLQEIRMMISDDDEQRLNKLLKNARIGTFQVDRTARYWGLGKIHR